MNWNPNGIVYIWWYPYLYRCFYWLAIKIRWHNRFVYLNLYWRYYFYIFYKDCFGQLSLSNVAFCLLFILLYYLLASIQVGWSFVYISSSVIVVSLFMSLYGIAQYIGLISSRHLFMVVGSFDNPAGYASMLSMSIPFVCYYIYSDKCNKKLPYGLFILWLF